jgi:hypothetical protein
MPWRAPARDLALAGAGVAENICKRHPHRMPFAYSVPTIVVVVVVMVVVMVAVRARSNPDVNTGAMMVMMVMVMSDDNLGSADAAALCQPRIVGF